MSNKTINFNANLNVENNLNVQGNLNVKGSTNTINQETLTVKDNFIAVNGNGTTLDTVGMAGIIAVTGGENLYLLDGQYWFNWDNLISADCPNTFIPITLTESVIPKFNSLKLYAYIDDVNAGKLTFESDHNSPPNYCLTINKNRDTMVFAFDYNFRQISDCSGGIYDSIIFKNQIIPESEIDFIKSFLCKDTDKTPIDDTYFVQATQAYAAPIYDNNDDSLKIGVGKFTRDDNGNIVNFDFGSGQSQSIATRDDNIKDNHLVKWNADNSQLIDSDVDVTDLIDKIDIATSLSLENGEGVNSIIQSYSGDDAANININTGESAVVLGQANKNELSSRTLIVGKNNEVIRNDTVGGSNNLVTGASNIVVASTGATIGNGNIVGDATGEGILKEKNQVNNSLVAGFSNIVQKTTRSLISGESNTVAGANASLISGKNNKSMNFGSVTLLGEGLEATSNWQTIVGAYNDPSIANGYFAVGTGSASQPSTSFVVDKNLITNKVKTVFENDIESDYLVAGKSEIVNKVKTVFEKDIQATGATFSEGVSGKSAVFTNMRVDGPLIVNSRIEATESSKFAKDVNVTRALYCPNIFKGSNSEENKVLSKSEIEKAVPVIIHDINESTKCVFTIKEANTTIALKNLTGLTKIDWGDGTVDTELSHNYAKTGTYNCFIYGVTEIGEAAFTLCHSLTGLEISNTVTIIGEFAFSYTNLSYVHIGDSVTEIGKHAFDSTHIDTLVLSPGIKKIESGAFACSNLRHIELPNSLETIGPGAFELAHLETIEIPSHVTDISAAFAHIPDLKNVILNEGLTNISGAFRDASITEIEIPSTVNTVGDYTFSGCHKLKTITLKSTQPPELGVNTAIPTTIEKIVVPIQSIQLYKEAPNWAAFADKIVGIVDTAYLDEKLENVEYNLNLDNGLGEGSIQQENAKYFGDSVIFSDGTKGIQTGDTIPGASATGSGAAAFGGLRYDYYTSPETHQENLSIDPTATEHWGRTPTSAEGIQSFAGGGSSHAYGDWSFAFGKDNKAYQRSSVALGGSAIAGNPDGNAGDYSFAFAMGEATKAKGRASVALNDKTNANGLGSFAIGCNTVANNDYTIAAGYASKTYSKGSNAIGWYCKTGENETGDLVGQTVLGKFNTPISTTGLSTALLIVGNGDSDASRSNALVVYKDGKGQLSYAGNLSDDKDIVTYKHIRNNLGLSTKDFTNGKVSTSSATANSNTKISSSNYGLAIGYTNDLGSSNQSILVGYGNKIAGGYQGAAGLGKGLIVKGHMQTVIGAYNEEKTGCHFVVGCGTSNTDRKNALEILTDGRTKVYGTPTEDNDVVRLGELKSLLKLIDGLTDVQITALNKFAKSLTAEEQ